MGCNRKPSSQTLSKSSVSAELHRFVAEKKTQAIFAAKMEGKEMLPEYKALFAAAERIDDRAVNKIFEELAKRSPHFEGKEPRDERLHGIQWEAVKEVWGAVDCLASEEKYPVAFGREIIDSIPPGSIYFGGSDPGRWVITALQKSHVKADPFFTLTQNALADGKYLEYLNSMYGHRIYVPSNDDSQHGFQEYMADAQARIIHDQQFSNEARQVKPGEDVNLDQNTGRVQISGQIAVMSINALLAKIVFDKNPDREFFVEESFPLDWMYSHLEPHGLIIKINRQPLVELFEEIILKDHAFWTNYVAPAIGDWVNYDTSVKEVCEFAEKVYHRHNFTGFQGDPEFVRGESPKWLSKLRSSIGGIYLWRLGMSPSGGIVPKESAVKNQTEHRRMLREADFAFKQALAICPESPEVIFRYVNFLLTQQRLTDAILIAETAVAINNKKAIGDQFDGLLKQLKAYQKSKP
ncbi:MAG: hypothetical protein QOD03_1095 [Verrucomicrobiota bacterium]